MMTGIRVGRERLLLARVVFEDVIFELRPE